MEPFLSNILSDLESALSKNSSLNKPTDVIGSQSSTVLASILGSPDYIDLHRNPQLVIVSSDAEAKNLEEDLKFFNPTLPAYVLQSYDVSPYSALYPNFRSVADRINWLYRAQYSMGGEVFIASIQALAQKSLPKELLDKLTTTLKINDELEENFVKKLSHFGYQTSPRVEDVGQISVKGGIIDIFSPAHPYPIRVELFGDNIESLRYFSAETQRTLEPTDELVILPVREVIFDEGTHERVLSHLNNLYREKEFSKEFRENIYESLMFKRFFHGIDFLIPYFYETLNCPIEFFDNKLSVYYLDPLETTRQYDKFISKLKSDFESLNSPTLTPEPSRLFAKMEDLKAESGSKTIHFAAIEVLSADSARASESSALQLKSTPIQTHTTNPQELLQETKQKISLYLSEGKQVIVSTHTTSQAERIKVLLEQFDLPCELHDASFANFEELFDSTKTHIIPRSLSESIVFGNSAFLREEDFFGKKERSQTSKTKSGASKSIILSDLRIGDFVTHTEFGVGIYEGLKMIKAGNLESEFIQIKYEGDDKLYLPVYRINLIRKYSGVGSLDKLGSNAWEKTKIKVKNHLKDIASELLTLYAKRSQVERPPFKPLDIEYKTFEGQFAYDETEDQLNAIEAILEDMQKPSPMDRLVCGDVGFGKTEVAMRAAFKCVQDQRQVAVLVPTTILSFQHFETFKKRFNGWPVQIEMLSRFTSGPKAREVVENLKTGKVDIVIGTHRVLSKDIQFKNLGLLVVDEEHKFGVTHKEKIKKMKTAVDTIAMSATPIPRTLNMSLMGIRDLSLINTAPQDRLPVRTFICKSDDTLIQNAIDNEVQRGGQVYFLHNRVQTIAGVAQRLQELCPGVRIRYAHGQMKEDDLEKIMISFFQGEFDVLVSTTIIESGMDVPKANTIIIDRADTLGLSQLYQLRGRVGRSNERAYCYLVIPRSGAIDPTAQERLKVLQENTDLGSGIRIAHHDLELRGAGSILGEAQSGHANSVGYELYIELLEQALKEARGEDTQRDELEPEINLRIPALIPHDYILDIRVRMGYYNALAQIESPDDMDRYESELMDQFGKVPEPVMNLMGVMLLKKFCKDLAIRDLSAGTKAISLAFTDFTPMKPDIMIELVTGNKKKYSITPDSRLIIQMNEISWPQIYSELNYLMSYI